MSEINVMSLFQSGAETIADAKRKAASEKEVKKTQFFQMSKDGKYTVRILPNAPLMVGGEPVLDADGKPTYANNRKSYEYPVQSMIMSIVGTGEDGQSKNRCVTVPRGKFVGLPNDVIDVYRTLALAECDKIGGKDGEELRDKIKGSTYVGGLNWQSQRVMYVLDMNDRASGIKMLKLSNAQYNDLETRKLSEWEEDPESECPISSIKAYPVEINRSKNKGKTEYSFTIKTKRIDVLEEAELSALLDAPRIPDVLYRYSRFHLEATQEFLKQYDDKLGLNICQKPEFKQAVEQVSAALPSDDTSHFSFDSKSAESEGEGDNAPASTASIEEQISDFRQRAEQIKDMDLSESKAATAQLKDDLRTFCTANDLVVTFGLGKSLDRLIEDIEYALEDKENGGDDADDNAEHNMDTNEPATRPARREVSHSAR